MNLRNWLFVLYCAILIGGTAIILNRNGFDRDDFMTARELPANWRLQPGNVVVDLVGRIGGVIPGGRPALTDFDGRYVRGHFRPNEPIRLHQTDTVPHVTAPPGHVLLMTPLGGSAKHANAGTCVGLAGEDKTPVPVAAVLCPAEATGACSAILDMPIDRVAKLTAGGKSLPAVTGTIACPKDQEKEAE
jgi:hypothetical protein